MRQELINLWSEFLSKLKFTFKVDIYNEVNYITLHFNYNNYTKIKFINLIEEEDKSKFTNFDAPLLILSEKLTLVDNAHCLYTNGNPLSFISIGKLEYNHKQSYVFITHHNNKPGITFEHGNKIYYYSYCDCDHEWKKHRDNVINNNTYINLFACE